MKATLKRYFLAHVREASNALTDLFRTKMASIMTIGVIGIALALPASFLMVLSNAKALAETLEGAPQISIFLKTSVTEEKRSLLEKRFKEDPKIAKFQYISKEQALKEFTQDLNLQEVVNLMPENPLPATFVLSLKELPSNASSEEMLQSYTQSLRNFPEVESVQLDLDWVKRLSSGLNVAERLVTGLTTLLALAVLMVVGNTLRLHIENKKDVIEVSKWVGATDAFVRRPFLYLGLWYGICGSMVALLIVLSLSLWIGVAALDLLSLYQSSLHLIGLSFSNALLLLLLGALLGLGGAWLSVGRQLRNLRPC